MCSRRMTMRVVALLGSSTAGKSTICSKLEKEHHWTVVSIDGVCEKINLERQKKLDPAITAELGKTNCIEILRDLMSEDLIKKFCIHGKLTIPSLSINHQFLDYPVFNDISLVLKASLIQKGYTEIQITNTCESLAQIVNIGIKIDKENPFLFSDAMDLLYDETFNHDPDDSIVLDIVPDLEGNVAELLEQFEKRAQQYRNEHQDQELSTAVIFAYCPPQVLSERIHARNIEAEKNDPTNKREGIFPFQQLGSLVTTTQNQSKNLGTLSNDEVLKFVAKHSRMQPPENIDAENKTNIYKRIAKKMHEYKDLSSRFGLWNRKLDEQVPLALQMQTKIDGIINTSLADPINQFLHELERIENSNSEKNEQTTNLQSGNKL